MVIRKRIMLKIMPMRLFLTQLIVSGRKQLAYMADEKSH